jgi:ribosome-associated heat shock protein Hsp15
VAESEDVRLDKWLWAARFYKTRKLATDAVTGGKVHVNGQRVKPGKEVKVGMLINIAKDRYEWDITVTNLNHQRRPASEAVLMYCESSESQTKRQEQLAQERAEKALFPQFDRAQKPNKKDRRLIHRFKQG